MKESGPVQLTHAMHVIDSGEWHFHDKLTKWH